MRDTETAAAAAALSVDMNELRTTADYDDPEADRRSRERHVVYAVRRRAINLGSITRRRGAVLIVSASHVVVTRPHTTWRARA